MAFCYLHVSYVLQISNRVAKFRMYVSKYQTDCGGHMQTVQKISQFEKNGNPIKLIYINDQSQGKLIMHCLPW